MLKKILLVDDIDDARELLKFLLELSDYEVIEAVNGKEAINSVKKFHPDLVLMDIAMPVMNGLSAARIIKSSEDSANVPIIAVTGFRNYYADKVIAAGCDNMIDKPVDFHKLDTVLNLYLA